jgi:hypothetical protein
VGLAVSEIPNAARAESPHAGPLFDEFDLTLAPGHRTEALGPFFYSEQKETRRTWAVNDAGLALDDAVTDRWLDESCLRHPGATDDDDRKLLRRTLRV